MSSSREGKILLNILKSFPKRGIWIIRQEGAWTETNRQEHDSALHLDVEMIN